MISTAVGAERVSRVVGYKPKKGNFLESSPNLPQRILILAEGNTENQATMPVEMRELTSQKEAGDLYGYGSPIHQIMRILRPVSGDGVGGIPTIVFPQTEGTATAAVIPFDVTISTTATDSATHYAVINGRKEIDGKPFAYSVVKGDTDVIVIGKIVAAINNVLGAPVVAATVGSPVTSGTLTTKWAGITAAGISLTFDTGGKDCGITYVVSATTGGTGAADISDALAAIGSEWNTIVINSHGTATFDALESFNGVPDPDNPTGRYQGIVFKPFIAIWGSTEDDKDALATITNASARLTQVTNALAPAPLSAGMPWEAAANMAYLFALTAQNSPHLDINSKAYPDMPVPSDGLIGDMADYTNRDYLVQKGCSTIDLIAGKYVVQDFVTTYHPDGEIPPQYRYCRNLMLDFNWAYGYNLLVQTYLVNKTIVPSNQSTNVDNVVKPKDWKQKIFSYIDDTAQRALISDSDFSKDNLQVQVSDTNPDRFDTRLRYKRSGTVRISSTDVEAGFAFGVV